MDTNSEFFHAVFLSQVNNKTGLNHQFCKEYLAWLPVTPLYHIFFKNHLPLQETSQNSHFNFSQLRWFLHSLAKLIFHTALNTTCLTQHLLAVFLPQGQVKHYCNEWIFKYIAFNHANNQVTNKVLLLFTKTEICNKPDTPHNKFI